MIRASRKPANEAIEPTRVGLPALIRDVLEQGIVDAVKGDPEAQAWLHTRAFEYWCDAADYNPDYVRSRTLAAVGCAQKEARRFFTDDELNRAIWLHEHGQYWKSIIVELKTNMNAMITAIRATGYYEAARDGGHGKVIDGKYTLEAR